MTFKSFSEGVFIYLLLNTNTNRQYINKARLLIFALICSLTAVLFSVFLNLAGLYRLILLVFVFFYFRHKQRRNYSDLVISCVNTKNDIVYSLTTAIVLVLAVHSFNYISHMILHSSFVLSGIYGTVCSVDIFYQLYKTMNVFLDVLLVFLTYKFRLINMKDIKAMSLTKWAPISFGFCLLSMFYIGHTYYILYDIPLTSEFRNTLLWIMAFILPSYIGFYVAITRLIKLLNLRVNTNDDTNIHVWLSNPSVLDLPSLCVYNLDELLSDFEMRKLDIKRILNKLGINDECKGYSELILCLFLTRLLVHLKGWRFDIDIFLPASLIIDIPVSKLRENLECIIERIWTTTEVAVLIDEYYLPYHQATSCNPKNRPTVEEFLSNVAESF